MRNPSRHLTHERDQRQQILAMTQAIEPFDGIERVHRIRTLEWIGSGAELCRTVKPATPPTHLVAYFAVVDGDSLLLVDHKNARLWLPPGGHVEPGEHPRHTVIREAKEELNLPAQFVFADPLFLTYTETVGLSAGHTDVSLWFVLRGERGSSLVYDQGEFNDARWFTFDEAPLEKSDPHLARFLAKLRSVS